MGVAQTERLTGLELMFNLNDSVRWKDCPGSLSAFSATRIRGLSPCGRFALVSWIRNPIEICLLTPSEPCLSLSLYRPIDRNHWGEDGVDSATGEDLNRWIQEYERRTSTQLGD